MAEDDLRILEWSPDERFIKCMRASRDLKAYDLEDGCEVHWQSIALDRLEERVATQVLQDIEESEALRHPNILQTKAHWVTAGRECKSISEYHCQQSLREFLEQIQHPRRRLVKHWSRQVLEGLNYLHSRRTPVTHRDVKLDNILVDPSSGNLKITGLGLAKYLSAAPTAGTLKNRYWARESYEQQTGPSADVYAFGLVLLEICTRNKAYSECKTEAAIQNKVLAREVPMALKAVQDQEILDLVQQCLQPAAARPTASELLKHAFFTSEWKAADREPVALNFQFIKKTKITVRLQIKKEEAYHCVAFNYNFNKDTPEFATNRIISNFGLSKSNFSMISSEILKVLSSAVA